MADDEWVGGNPNETPDEQNATQVDQPESRRSRRQASAAEPDDQAQVGMPDMDHIGDLIEDLQDEEVFDFLETVDGIQRPRDTCRVYLDETAIYTLNHLLTLPEKDRSEHFGEEVAKLRRQIAAKTYTFHLVGLSVERQKELELEAEKEIPNRFTQVKVPGAGIQRQALPNPQQDDLKSVLKWSEMIEKIVMANGREILAPGRRYAEKVLKMPVGSIINFQQKVTELEVATMGFEQTTDATFPG